MTLTLNGQTRAFAAPDPIPATAGELLMALAMPRERVAVVLNENVLRRADLDATAIADGDIVEIITMVGGG